MTKKRPPKTNVIPFKMDAKKTQEPRRESCSHDERLCILVPRLAEELPMLGADIKKLRARLTAVGNSEFECTHKPENKAARDRLILLMEAIEDFEAVYDYVDANLQALFLELR